MGTGTVVGSLRAVDGKAVVRMEDAFGTDPEDLWSALTDPRRLARWVARVDGDRDWAASSGPRSPAVGKVPDGSTCASPLDGSW